MKAWPPIPINTIAPAQSQHSFRIPRWSMRAKIVVRLIRLIQMAMPLRAIYPGCRSTISMTASQHPQINVNSETNNRILPMILPLAVCRGKKLNV